VALYRGTLLLILGVPQKNDSQLKTLPPAAGKVRAEAMVKPSWQTSMTGESGALLITC